MSDDYLDINNYRMKKEIGEGNFGKVKLAEFIPTGEEFAIKILNKEKIKKKMKNVNLRENEIITKLNHINIVFVFNIIDTPENYYIIMEYCKLGELFDYIVKKKRLSEEEASVFFYQLINGVDYMHSKGIAHRDLKPENLLLTEDKILKIIDFGLSHEFQEDQFLKTKCGSPSYAAPEIIARENYDGFKIDIWCCGIILYAMLCGYLPFEGDSESETNNVELFKNILECNPDLPDFLSNISKDLIFEILNPDPEERISIKQIKKHPFYLKGKKLCNIDYKSFEKQISKARESFYNNKKKSNNNNKTINNEVNDKNNHLLDNTDFENINKNYNNNITIVATDGNIKSTGKNSIEILTNNKYKLLLNNDNNYYPNNNIENNIDKVTKAKLQLLSLKSKNKQKNELNSFKKKNNPINLHLYSKKGDNINNNRLQQILATETNENNQYGLPFIKLRDAQTIFNCLLSKPTLNSNDINNSLNARKNEEENNIFNFNKSPIKFVPQIPSKNGLNSLEYKINSGSKSRKPHIIKHYLAPNKYIIENMNLKTENNNINLSSNKNNNNDNIALSTLNNNSKIKEQLNINNLKNIGNGGVTKSIKTFSPGNIALTLSNENKMNKRKKYNRYNYEYDYNFKSSPNRKLIMKDSYIDSLNGTNNINNTYNINREIKTNFPINIKQSDKNIKTIIKKHSKGDNPNNSRSPEIKSIFNNIKINININSNSIDRLRDKKIDYLKTLESNNNLKYPYNSDPKNNNNYYYNKKLYMLTDANNEPNNNVYKSIALSPNKNNIFNSERSNKRKGISLPKNNIKNTKYNLTKIIQNVKNKNTKTDNNEMIKKNKSYLENYNTLDNEEEIKIKKNIKDNKTIDKIRNYTNDKRKNKEELLLRDFILKEKINQQNNKNNIFTLNNLNIRFLPKLTNHIYNHSEKNI